ncbi:hypothetical protein C8Q77DRAFT_1143609 [Trametes polyzona]|nr:hypothetical protein C8Q77DRAFT_1143609 [Trametes polyzona]
MCVPILCRIACDMRRWRPVAPASRILTMDAQNDVQMVSILYRTHRGLSTDAKGASLYAFDALARAARNRAVKNNLVGDLTAEKGNCATFLIRIEGILDGLYQDLLSTNNDSLKEKAKKILDIWTKQNTFSSAVLSPLYAMLKQTEKGDNKDQEREIRTEMWFCPCQNSTKQIRRMWQPPSLPRPLSPQSALLRRALPPRPSTRRPYNRPSLPCSRPQTSRSPWPRPPQRSKYPQIHIPPRRRRPLHRSRPWMRISSPS